jgi:hypothetical protein
VARPPLDLFLRVSSASLFGSSRTDLIQIEMICGKFDSSTWQEAGYAISIIIRCSLTSIGERELEEGS